MKFRNNRNTPSMEITLPNGMKIVATMSGYVEPGRENCDWAGINVSMVAPNGDYRPLCSAEYVEDVGKVRVFGNGGKISELDVRIEAPRRKRERRKLVSGHAHFRMKVA